MNALTLTASRRRPARIHQQKSEDLYVTLKRMVKMGWNLQRKSNSE
jgi:hypothetical protein